MTQPIAPVGSQGLPGRGLKPASVLADSRPHGDRLRYIGGCRCDECRRANTRYESERAKARKAGDWNGIVDAAKARAHMLKLAKAGIGRRAIAAATDIADSILVAIRAGTKTRIRARTERLILAVTKDVAADRALVPAGPSWKLIDELLEAGFTKGIIASRILGRETPALQLRKSRITVRHAFDVARVHRELMTSDERLVPAAQTWRYIAGLRDEGFTDKQLARHFGHTSGELEFSRKSVTAAQARQVKEVYERLMT